MDKLLDCDSGLSLVESLRCVFGNRDITKVTQNLGGGGCLWRAINVHVRRSGHLPPLAVVQENLIRLWDYEKQATSHYKTALVLKDLAIPTLALYWNVLYLTSEKNALEKTLSSSIYKCNCSYCSFFRLFGIPGVCAACSKPIAAFEFVMRAAKNAYHIECFSCQICRQRFRVGENFHFYNNKVLCWDHYRIEKEGETTTENST